MERGLRLPVYVLRLLLIGASLAGSILLLVRAFAGPNTFVHNPIALECGVAVSILLALFTARAAEPAPRAPGSPRWLMAVVLLEVGVAFGSILSMPLVTDDYIHIRQTAMAEVAMPMGCITNEGAGSQFYRPIGCLSTWLDWALWGADPISRHAMDLTLHAASSLLFFILLRRLDVARPFDILGALAFTWHGIRPETVAWSAARFDALALFFSLVAAVAVLGRSWVGFTAALLATELACLSKESAFVLPILLIPLVLRRDQSRGRDPRATRLAILQIAAFFAVAGTVFALRWWALKGIGGYVDTGGAPRVLDFNALTFAKTFFARIWGILWFPVNWSAAFEWWMLAGFAAGIVGSVLMLRARPGRVRLTIALACAAAACIPAHHLLLIDASLERSRYLTLASAPFVIALVFAWTGLPRRLGILAATLVVTFQVAAVDHNLKIWKRVAVERHDACRDVAAFVKQDYPARPIVITGMPFIVNGVYWRNGFEDCLWLDYGINLGRVRVNGVPPAEGELEVPWGTLRK